MILTEIGVVSVRIRSRPPKREMSYAWPTGRPRPAGRPSDNYNRVIYPIHVRGSVLAKKAVARQVRSIYEMVVATGQGNAYYSSWVGTDKDARPRPPLCLPTNIPHR